MADPYAGVIAWNDFEGGSDGVAVSAANSGGGTRTAFTQVQLSGSSTVNYTSSSPIHGAMSCLVTGNAGLGMLRYDSAVVGNQTGQICGAVYLEYVTLPSAYSPIVEGNILDAGGLSWRIGVSSLGNVRLYNATAGTVASTTTTPISTGTVYRLEWQIHHGTGAYGVQVFAGDSTSPAASFSGTSAGAFDTATQRVNFGRLATPDFTVKLDTVALATTPLGPRNTQEFVWAHTVSQG